MIEALIERGAPRRGDGGPGERPGAHRREAGGPVDGAGRPVHRSPRADVPAASWTGSRRWTPRSRTWRRGSPATAARWQREIDLLKTIPGFGDVVAWAWIAEIGPAPHQWFGSHEKLASWVSLAPGNYVSAGKRKHGRTGDAGTYIKPMLVQAAWAAIRVQGTAAGPVQPAGPPHGRGEEPGREEEGHRGDRAHPAQDRLHRPQGRAPPTRTWEKTSTPGAKPRSSARPGWSARSRSSTPAAPSPSPSARPDHAPEAALTRRLTRQPRPDRSPGAAASPAPPVLPPDKSTASHSPRIRTRRGSADARPAGPSFRVSR